MRYDDDALTEVISRAMKSKPGTVTHVDIVHKDWCLGDEDCNCNPEYRERRVN